MKLLVHFHLYYHDQLGWFLERLSNLSGFDYDLVVTYVEENQVSLSAIRELNPGAKFIKVSNQGYDIWPFIQVIKSVDLDRYACVLKIHTKAALNELIHIGGRRVTGFTWRDNLVDTLIGSPETVLENLRVFASNPEVGMICDVRYYIRTEFWEDRFNLVTELRRLGFKTRERRFCAGTMFLIRSEALEYLKSEKIGPELFGGEMLSHSRGSMAHIYERILSIAVPAGGYRVMTIGLPPGKKALYLAHVRMSSLVKLIFSLERRGDRQAKVLTVFGFRFRLDDGPGTSLHTTRLHRTRQ